MRNGMNTKLLGAVCFAALIAWLTMSVLAAGEDSVGKEKRHIYLLIGGGNMAGRAPFTNVEMGIIPQCELLNDENEWEPATLPLNRYSSLVTLMGAYGMNPGYLFAQTMSANEPGVSIALVVNAIVKRRRSKISEWVKGSPSYDDAVRRTKIAQKTGILKGILWNQGMSNVNDADYLEKLKVLITGLRKDLGDPNLPFVAGQLPPKARDAKLFNDRILKLPGEVPFTGVVESDGCKSSGRIWFDAKSMKILGWRYAEAMLKLQGREMGDIVQAKPLSGPLKMPERPGYDGPKENLHIYLLIGQSNMAGRADYLKEDAAVIERCWLLNGENKWEPANIPLNRYSSIIDGSPINSNRMNPGYLFAKTMLKNDPSINIGIISNARGSTFIKSWQRGHLDEALKRLKVAQETGVLKGILWQQGEADFKKTDYLDALKVMIGTWRTKLGMPELPFVAGGLVQLKKHKLVNEQIEKLPGEMPFTGVAGSKGLTGKGVHFNMDSMRIFGERYAETMLKIQGESKSGSAKKKR